MNLNIKDTGDPRVVIIGAGFAGLQLARKLAGKKVQVVLLDKNNYHQFQPLFYQVAMAGLEPSSISFPLRKVFQKKENVVIRPVEVERIDHEANKVLTTGGDVTYDYLVVATGTKTNFFGSDEMREKAFSLKNVSEALYLRNSILEDFEKSLREPRFDERQRFLDVVIVGGGPTGVEVAGALAEMRTHILPKDYPELNSEEVDIYLLEGSDRLLSGMSKKSSNAAISFLEELGVQIKLNSLVQSFDGRHVHLKDGQKIEAGKVIWCAGVKPVFPPGLPDNVIDSRSKRILVDAQCRVRGISNIYALGDVCLMQTDDYPKGHPQVAQVAIQQANYLAKNWKRDFKFEGRPFKYNDKGSMATIGRNRAVVDLPNFHMKGWLAWIVWLLVHLMALIGARNKVVVMLNWMWNYLTYDQSLRLIIKPYDAAGK